MTTHTQSPRLPGAPRRGRRRGACGADDGGGATGARVLARVFCGVLALVGLLPFVATLVVRSAWARDWAARETQRILAPARGGRQPTRRRCASGRSPSSSTMCASSRATAAPRSSSAIACPASAALRAPGRQARHRPGRARRAARPRRRARRQAREPRAQALGGPKSEGPFHAPFNTFSRDRRIRRSRPRRGARLPPSRSTST